MPRDQLFQRQVVPRGGFRFDSSVVAVFDDMLDRSVPFYREMQRMITEMAADFAVDGTNIYDLGCSTGNTLIGLDARIKKGVRFIGVDYSAEMLKRCEQNLADAGFQHDRELICADLNQGVRIDNASMVLMVLTLQFVRPLYRGQHRVDAVVNV